VSILATLLGAALIVVALRDIFQQLFKPSGGGVLSRRLMWVVWRGFRRFATRRPGLLRLAGPVLLVAIIAGWASLLVMGFALVYWPRMPWGVLLQTGLDPASQGGFLDALYLSSVTLATLGYGDTVPTNGWLRALAPLEALVGFGLLTAAISWVLSIYPVLSRRRALAREVSLLRGSEREIGAAIERLGADAAERTLKDLTSRLIVVQGDLVQFPVTYHFHDAEEDSSLPLVLPYLLRLAERAGGADLPPEVRLRASMLRGAVGAISAMLASKAFLGLSSGSTEEVLEAYARDHLRAAASKDRVLGKRG